MRRLSLLMTLAVCLVACGSPGSGAPPTTNPTPIPTPTPTPDPTPDPTPNPTPDPNPTPTPPPPGSVVLGQGDIVGLPVAGACDLNATVEGGGAVVWTTADPAVATIDASGRLVARAPGQTTVRAANAAAPQMATSLTVSVVPAEDARLTLPVTAFDLNPGETTPVGAELDGLACAEVEYSGGTFTPDGLFTAPTDLGERALTVTARTGDVVRTATASATVRAWTAVTPGELPVGLRPSRLALAPNGDVYLATYDGVFRLDPVLGQWRALRGQSGGLNNTTVLDLAFTARGMYAATRSGVFVQRPGKTSWQPTQTSTSSPYVSGLPDRPVLDLMVHQDVLYAALEAHVENGVSRAVFRYDETQNVWTPVGTFPGTVSVGSIAMDGEGRLYATQNGGPIWRFEGGAWSVVNALRAGGVTLGPDGAVYALCGSGCPSGDGVYRIDGSVATVVLRNWPLGGLRVLENQLYFLGGTTIRRLEGSWTALPGAVGRLPFDGQDLLRAGDGRLYALTYDLATQRYSLWRSARGTLDRPGEAVTVTDVTVTPARSALRVGTNVVLRATVGGRNSGQVFWTSSNKAVVRVDAQGVLTGVAPGTAVVTVRAQDDIGTLARVPVVVTDPRPGVGTMTVTPPEAVIEAGASVQLRAPIETKYLGIGSLVASAAEPDRRVTWAVSDERVATINADGLVTGRAAGAVVVTATAAADPSVRATASVTVTPGTPALAGAGVWEPDATVPIGRTLTGNEEIRDIGVGSGRLFVSLNGLGLWSRALGGTTWRSETGVNQAFDFVEDDEGRTYASGNEGWVGVYDGGVWRSISVPRRGFVAKLATDGPRLYAAVSGSSSLPATVFVREDGVWRELGGGLPSSAVLFAGDVGGLAARRGAVFVAMNDGQVYRYDGAAFVPHANRRVERNGSAEKFSGLVMDDGGTLFLANYSNVLQLRPSETQWRPLHSVGRIGKMIMTSHGPLVSAVGQAYLIRPNDLQLVRVSTTRLPDKLLHGVAADSDGNVYAGVSFTTAPDVNVYRVRLDSRMSGARVDLPVTSASYLGGAGEDTMSAVDLASDGTIVMAGMLENATLGAEPTTLLGGGTGAVVRLSGDGRRVLSVTRVGDVISDLEIDRTSGRIAVVGDFGVAVLSSDARNVVWSARAFGRETDRRVAAARDGTVVTLTAASGGGRLVTTYGPDGRVLGTRTFGDSFVLDVAVDAASDTVFVTGYNNRKLPPDNTIPNAPVQVAFLRAFTYDLRTVKWVNWDYPGADLNGQEADTRGYRVAMGRDEKLYFLGENAGGNSIFRFDPRSPIGTMSDGRRGMTEQSCGCWVQYDEFNQPYNTSDPHFAYYARIEPTTGRILKGQFAVPRLPSTKSNTFRVRAITADETGRVYVGGVTAFALQNRNGKTVAGQSPTAYNGGDLTMLVVAEDFGERLVWHPLNRADPNGAPENGVRRAFPMGSTAMSGVAAADGKVVFTAVAGGPLVTHEAIVPEPSADIGTFDPDGYFVVVPMP